MDFLSRRTIRKYTSQEIEEKKITELLETALVSPSGRNAKPFELIVIKNKETLKKLALSKATGSAMLNNAALAILILGNPEVSSTWIEDSSIVSYTLQLKAYDLGIGSCWINIKDRQTADGINSETYVQNLLNIPNHLKIVSIISFGYPDETKIARSKSDMDFSKIHYDKY